MIYSLYGQPGSGKTTLGKLLADHLDTPFVIDGDEFREMFTNTNYDREGREENIRSANAVATYLSKKSSTRGHVVMSIVNPYSHLRNDLKRNNKGYVTEVHLTSERDLRKEYHVEDFEAGNPHHTISTDQKEEDSWSQLKDLLKI
jgi:adenylylsulfate kinase-like enzyme